MIVVVVVVVMVVVMPPLSCHAVFPLLADRLGGGVRGPGSEGRPQGSRHDQSHHPARPRGHLGALLLESQDRFRQMRVFAVDDHAVPANVFSIAVIAGVVVVWWFDDGGHLHGPYRGEFVFLDGRLGWN